ncbi:MAG: hypothetical protein JSS76_16070 [Bacteroidetes bacterium]|nr:hypothetical protein [Bacteroidota bacterium]
MAVVTKTLIVDDKAKTELDCFINTQDKAVIRIGEIDRDPNDYTAVHLIAINKEDLSEFIKQLKELESEMTE